MEELVDNDARVEALNWEMLAFVLAAYSTRVIPHWLFASIDHALAYQTFGSYEDVKKSLNEYFAKWYEWMARCG